MRAAIGRAALLGVLCSLSVALLGSAALAAPAPPPEPLSPRADSLVPVPEGCPIPDPADVAFVGTMMGKDDVTQTVRFRIDQLRAGSASPWAIDGLIDVRYGDDYRFLDEGDEYLVGAGFDTTYGALSSTVRPPEPLFGGNDVVGVDDIAITCPIIDQPVRTLNVDGTSVDSGVMTLMVEDRRLLLATFAVPAALVFAALLALVVLKVFGVLAMRGVFQLGRAAVTPVQDHRAVRIRRHRESDQVGSSGVESSADAAGETDASPGGDDRSLDLVDRS